jgi:hypothetical protein
MPQIPYNYAHHTNPLSAKLFSLLTPLIPVPTPTLVTAGGHSRNTVFLVNILKSGRSRSHGGGGRDGGGGLGGALTGYFAGRGTSGNMMSSFHDLRDALLSDFLDAAGEMGVDIEPWIAWSGSWVMMRVVEAKGSLGWYESYDS